MRRMKIKITFVSHVRFQSGVYIVVGHSCESIKSYYDLFVFRVTFFVGVVIVVVSQPSADVPSEWGDDEMAQWEWVVDVDSKTFSEQNRNPLDTYDSWDGRRQRKNKMKFEAEE